MTTPIGWGGNHVGQFTNVEFALRAGVVGVRRVLAVLLNVPTNNNNTDIPFTLGNMTTYAGQTNNASPTSIAGTVLTQGLLGPAGFTGQINYMVRDVQFNNSILSTTGATASNSTTSFGLFTAASAGGTGIVATATLALASNLVNAYATVVTTTSQNTTIASTLFLRTTAASAVANSQIDVYIWGDVLP